MKLSITWFKEDESPVLKKRQTRADGIVPAEKKYTSADKTFLGACVEGIEESHFNLKIMITKTQPQKIGFSFWCGDFKVFNILCCEYLHIRKKTFVKSIYLSLESIFR